MIIHLLIGLIELYVIALIARALLSWFPTTSGTLLDRVVRFLALITEPVLRPIRRLLPPVRAGGMAIDLSVIVAIVVAQLLVVILNR